ncbi:MAG TPA: magnesium chelatase ATPase subunit D [Bryobacteraceae bacterium]|nr:magnesium chelatase ATPase subunit D [Bryobacteraceae bacterium]
MEPLSPTSAFPFAAVAGMQRVKEALLLLAVDPGLRGVLVASGPGTAKSLLGRAFPSLFPGERPPFVELPLGVTEDLLLGGVDLRRTLLTGRRHVAGGILARADTGILHVDGINLLDRAFICHLDGALTAGVVRLEREGFSLEFPSDFILIGTYDPEEGEMGASLVDLVGLHAREPEPLSREEHIELLSRFVAFDRDPHGFILQYAPEMALVRTRIAEARRRLPKVAVAAEDRHRLSLASLRLGVQGHRADLFAVQAARARAALMGHARLQEEDLEVAMRLVIIPRAAISQEDRLDVQPEQQSSQPAPRRANDVENVPVQPAEGSVPEALLALSRENLRKNADVRRGRSPADTTAGNRGRYVRAVARKPTAGKIAIDATLRAAAPFQMLRRPAPDGQPQPLKLAPSDLRFKQFKQKAGILIIFVVDASGSMALNRMSQAKGALIHLLQKAYLHRDKVALIAFRGESADVLLPPSRSVELATRALEILPVGGGTPLAAGLQAALDLARRDQYSQNRRKLLVLFTDGRANVAQGSGTGQIWHELRIVSAALQHERVTCLIIDTTHAVVSTGQTERLAELLGGRHFHLPRRQAGALCDMVTAMAETVRHGGA